MRVVDLFCGCGGLSLGFQNAGYEVVAAYDKWEAALDVYRLNFTHAAESLDLSNVQASAIVIDRHHRHQTGILADRRLQISRIDDTVFVNRQQGDFKALIFQLSQGVQYRVMLKGCRDDVRLTSALAVLCG